MTISVNIKTNFRFKINGKEYHSMEEVPENMREAVKKAMASRSGSGQAASGITHKKIIFNGTEYDSVDAMPQDVREIYEKALSSAEGITGLSDGPVPEINGMKRDPAAFGYEQTEGIPQPTKFESSFSPRMLIILAGIIALFILVYYIWKVR